MSAADKHTNNSDVVPGRGLLRLKSDSSGIDVLGDAIRLPFSGRVAKNRFLKAPMTERLCSWNVDSDDIVGTAPVRCVVYLCTDYMYRQRVVYQAKS